MKVTLYTDGSSRGNPGPGGWGCVLVTEHKSTEHRAQSTENPEYTDEVIELGGYEEKTTNNRMELMAAIMGLREIGKGATSVEICTDSEYVKKGITEWIKGWIARGWKGSTKRPVLNQDLWQMLKAEEDRLIVLGTAVKWTYVRGHSGVPLNERADVIATACADSVHELGTTNLQLYRGPKSEYAFLV